MSPAGVCYLSRGTDDGYSITSIVLPSLSRPDGQSLTDDLMRVCLIGGRPYVRIALIVKFTQNDRTNMAHECHSHWMREVEFDWREQNLGSQTQVSLLHYTS
jgi:hypothetical protein